jgi:hypothetical protein
MGRTDVRGGVSWERSGRYVVCSCGAICVKPGWFERAVNSFYGRNHVCCICSGEASPCINCRKMRRRESRGSGSGFGGQD